MKMHSTRRAMVALLGTFALLLAACAENGGPGTTEPDATEPGATEPDATEPDATGEFPLEQITWIMPTDPGGSVDSMSRTLAPYLEEALGVTIRIENHPGGGGAVSLDVLDRADESCDTWLTYAVPHILFAHVTIDGFEYDDVAPVARVLSDPGVIRVLNDAPWETLQDLIDDAAANPGSMRASVSTIRSSNAIGLLQIEEATGAQITIVPFDGGSPARTALLGGHVELTHAGVFNSLPLADDTRVLAVHAPQNNWPDLTDNAPTVNEALGLDLPANSSNNGIWVNSECAQSNPDTVQQIADAVEQVVTTNADYRGELEAQGQLDSIDFAGPEEYDADNRASLSDAIQIATELDE